MTFENARTITVSAAPRLALLFFPRSFSVVVFIATKLLRSSACASNSSRVNARTNIWSGFDFGTNRFKRPIALFFVFFLVSFSFFILFAFSVFMCISSSLSYMLSSSESESLFPSASSASPSPSPSLFFFCRFSHSTIARIANRISSTTRSNFCFCRSQYFTSNHSIASSLAFRNR